MTIPHQFRMTHSEPVRVAAYRAQTQSLFVPILIRKRCACNAIVTALQLTRYGRCEKCVRTA